MKKICILVACAIIGIIGCCTSVNAETITNLGTIEYMNSLQVDIISEEAIDLIFISTLWDENDITITNYGFNSVTNKTRFLLTSEHVNPEWWMKNEPVPYLYQCNSTGQIYRVFVNYTSIEIPLSPLEIEIREILGKYDIELNNDSNISDITDTFIDNITCDLISKNHSLNSKISELELLIYTYYELSDNHNLTCEQLNNITTCYHNLSETYDTLNNTYNITYTRLIEVGAKASQYESFYARITTSKDNTIWFEGDVHTTNTGYQKQIDDLKFGQEIGSLVLILAIVITVIICILIFRNILNKRKPSDSKLEDSTGYLRESAEVDNAIDGPPLPETTLLDKIPLLKRRKKQPKPATSSNPTSNQNPSNPGPNPLEQKIDQLTEKIETKMDNIKTELHTELTDYVDKLIATKKTKPKTGVPTA